MTIWDVLGLSPTTDQRAIKRAYAVLLKHNKPDVDPQAYQALREAYDSAIAYARARAASGNRQEREPRQTGAPVDRDRAHDRPPVRVTGVRDGAPEQSERASPEPRVQPIRQDRRTHNDNRPLDVQAIQTLVRGLVSTEDRNEAVRRFERIIDSDELLNLTARRAFEIQLFHHFLNCPPEHYRLRLVERAVEEFAWDSSTQIDPALRNNIDSFFSRLDAARRYSRLKDETASSKLASILTGPYEPRKFKWLLLRDNILPHIRNYLRNLEKSSPLAFDYEFDTKTVRWWRTKIESRPFTFPHLAFGAIAGFMLAIFAIDSATAERLASGAERALGFWAGLSVNAAVIIGSMVLMSAAGYGADLSLYKLWQRVSPAYRRSVLWFKSFAYTHILAGVAASILFALTLKTGEDWDFILSVAGLGLLVVTKHGVFFWCFLGFFAAAFAVGLGSATIQHELEHFPSLLVGALGVVWGQVLFFHWAHRVREWPLVRGNGTNLFIVYLAMVFVTALLATYVVAGLMAGAA